MKPSQEVAGLFGGRFERPPGDSVDLPGMPVIITHQGRGLLAQRLLRIETEDVLVAPGDLVQTNADRGEKVEGRFEIRCFATALQRSEPPYRLEIAQSAGCVLDIRLEMIDRVLILRVASLGQFRELPGHRCGTLVRESPEAFVQPLKHRRIAGHQAAVQQADG